MGVDVMQEDTQYEWLDDILHGFALAESLNETNLSEKLKRKVITADEFDDRLVESYRENKKQAKQAILSHIQEIHKAYGNCQNCYGKGYATVNDRWAGYDTDTDIGSAGGYLSGGKPNAMKFCTCERGKQLESHIREVEARAQFRILDRIDAEAADKPRSYLSEIVHREMARLKALQPTNSKEE